MFTAVIHRVTRVLQFQTVTRVLQLSTDHSIQRPRALAGRTGSGIFVGRRRAAARHAGRERWRVGRGHGREQLGGLPPSKYYNSTRRHSY